MIMEITIYIKKILAQITFLTYAKIGRILSQNGISIFDLYDGENTNLFNENLTNFSFSKSEFNLTSFKTDTILVKKTQEHLTKDLFVCILVLKNNIKNQISTIKEKVRNCEISNIDIFLQKYIKDYYLIFIVPYSNFRC